MKFSFALFISLFVSTMLLGQGHQHELTKVILNEESSLMIHGETNVNKFTCTYKGLKNNDTLEFILDESKTNAKFISSELKLKVDQFDCGSKMINKDFRELLQYQSHPYIVISFAHYEQLKDFDAEYKSPSIEELGYFDVAIQVAGHFENKKVEFFRSSKDNTAPFIGETNLDIRDFGLSAPEKFMGLIKVKEEIRIELLFFFSHVD